MGKSCRNLRARWTTEDLQKAFATIRYERIVADTARSFNVPRRVLPGQTAKDEYQRTSQKI